MHYFSCPSCENRESFRPVRENSDDKAKIGCGVLFFGGILPFLFFLNYQQQKIQCEKCGIVFRKPPFPTSNTTAFALWVLLLLVVSLLAGLFIESFIAEDYARTAEYSNTGNWVKALFHFLLEHPIMLSSSLILLVTTVSVSSVLVAAISQFRHSRRMKREYKTHVE